MSETSPATSSRNASAPSRWRKRLFIGALTLLPFAAILSAYIINDVSGDRALQEAIHEADRLDPDWRLQDLQAKREVISDADNSALLIVRVTGTDKAPIIPIRWPGEEHADLLRNLDPAAQLNEPQIKVLREELLKVSSAVAELRKLADMPRGRFAIDYTVDVFSTDLAAIQRPRAAANVLIHDAYLLAQEEKIDQAVVTCRALLNTGRSIGDEPGFVPLMVRVAVQGMAVQAIERVLAQGQASEVPLAALQKLLEDEAKQPLFWFAARGERAMGDRLMQASQAAAHLRHVGFTDTKSSTLHKPWSWIVNQFSGRSAKKDRARVLRLQTRMVEITKRPLHEQRQDIEDLEAVYAEEDSTFILALSPPASGLHTALRQRQAWLQAAIATIAVERYRLAHGRWPDSWAALTPGQLRQKPIDPADGKPLRFRRLADGLVIYSIGLDDSDDDGMLQRERADRESGDIGLRLWDVSKRRQPPMPPVPQREDEP